MIRTDPSTGKRFVVISDDDNNSMDTKVIFQAEVILAENLVRIQEVTDFDELDIDRYQEIRRMDSIFLKKQHGSNMNNVP